MIGVQDLLIRPLEARDSFAELTHVVRSAYQELADMGFRYWGTYQTEADTERRCRGGHCLVAELDGRLVGTVTCRPEEHPDTAPEWYRRPDVRIITQFAVLPELKGQGIGKKLMDEIERFIYSEGCSEAALDTAEGAVHLIAMYRRRGYRMVGTVDWRDTNYVSVLMSKRLRVSISTERLVLRDFRPEDRVMYGAWWGHEDYQTAYPPGSMTSGKASTLTDLFLAEQHAAPRTHYSLVIEKEGEMIGVACIRFNLAQGSASIGYELRPDCWGHGYASEAVKELLRMGFDEVEIPRIEAWVFGANHRSQKFLERHGFTKEGCLRAKVPWGNERMDDLIYSLLREEWLARPK